MQPKLKVFRRLRKDWLWEWCVAEMQDNDYRTIFRDKNWQTAASFAAAVAQSKTTNLDQVA